MIYKTIEEWIERNPNHIGMLPIEVCHQIWGTKKKEWVGLTCGDVVDAEQKCKHTIDEDGNIHFADNADFAHAIEEKLKQKNA